MSTNRQIIQKFNALVRAKQDAGMTCKHAVKAVVKEDPQLHASYVKAWTAETRAGNRPASFR